MEQLDSLFPPPVPVPLNHCNAYQLLVAVVLSAQTTDGAVNKATDALFAKVKRPSDMVGLGEAGIYEHIKTLGLAKNKSGFLFGLSVKLAETPAYQDGSHVPRTKEELTALPGVGDKTASVVLSQVYQVPNLAVDTHVHRLALRWALTKEQKNVIKVKADLEAAFPETVWNKVHLQMIYFGREYCFAKNHDARACPVCSVVVHGKALAPEQAATASPSKGIVFYKDRQAELLVSPKLTMGGGVVDSPVAKKKTNNNNNNNNKPTATAAAAVGGAKKQKKQQLIQEEEEDEEEEEQQQQQQQQQPASKKARRK